MNNILFLNHEQVCHAHDTFLNGCIELFGSEHVFEYPCYSKTHSDFQSHGHSYAWWCFNDLKHITSYSEDLWISCIKNKEIQYLVGNNRQIDTFISFLEKIDNESLKSIGIIFLEEEEDPGFNHHFWCLEKLKHVYHKIDIHYKVDYIENRVGNYSKIRPFYLSVPENKILKEINTVKPFAEREVDICYIVGNSHPNRQYYFNLLKEVKGNNIIEFGTHKYNLNQYFNTINNSKIFISVRGNGWSNTRNVEGPFCGAALFTESLDITIPNDYIDGHSAIFFNNENLIEKLNFYLENPKKLNSLAKKSRIHCLNYHTSVVRAKQMVNDIKNIKEIKCK